jgi:hypothetical protein
MIATCIGARYANCAGGRIRSVLSETHHFRARDHIDDSFGDLTLEPMRQGKNRARSLLFDDGGVDVWIAIAESCERIDEINIFIAVDIEETRSPRTLGEERGHA